MSEQRVRDDVADGGNHSSYRTAMPGGFLECSEELIPVLGAEGRRVKAE